MTENSENKIVGFINLTSKIVSAYVANNPVRPADLPDLINKVYTELSRQIFETAQVSLEDFYKKPTAAQIRKSVTPEGIVSFLDGKTYQTLKRHLTSRGLDPHSYRAHFGLPSDYPMVSANYAARRSALAKAIGLGQVADRPQNKQFRAMRGKKAV